MAFARARAGLARSIDNGNFFFAVSGVLGACAGAMYVVEQRNENIRATVAALQVDIATERRRQQEEAAKPFEFSDRPVLFSARVTRRIAPHLFDGPAALKHAKVDEIVGVLEVDTGPDQAYHVCRASRSEGLYPKHSLVQLAPPDKTGPSRD
jgi:hypothetical protein